MKVYKFGGASVRNAEGVRNIASILQKTEDKVFVIISAMGKTTNALEGVHEAFMANRNEMARERWREVLDYHLGIIGQLFADEHKATVENSLLPLTDEIVKIIDNSAERDDFDKFYDRIVSFGELMSTTIISQYLNLQGGVDNLWVDMRQLLVTDSRFREAGVNYTITARNICEVVGRCDKRVIVGQGFIGANPSGCTTTLGREGSDYSAAVVASVTEADSVTIWKDVPGILNADPKHFDNTVKIPCLNYLDAVELAHSGAQVIHPKTIKPLQNKNIPLCVKPFGQPDQDGTIICSQQTQQMNVPIMILKQNQILISIRPNDFSFVLEDKLSEIFSLMGQYRIKINLIQSSAVSLTVCVDQSRHIDRLIDQLQTEYKVAYNDNLKLLTIRGYDEELFTRYADSEDAFLVQRTRRTLRIVLKA
jgi:aspartate kinase